MATKKTKTIKKSNSKTSHKVEKKTCIQCLKLPLSLLVVWAVAAFITSYVNFGLYFKIFGGWNELIVQIFAFGVSGWLIIEDAEFKKLKTAAGKVGIMGALYGLVFGVFSLIMMKTNVDLFNYVAEQLTSAGPQGEPLIMFFTGTWPWINAFLYAPMTTAITAFIAALIGGFIAKKKWIKI